jgi:hypothetical protein
VTDTARAADQLRGALARWLAGLDAAQRARAVFPFEAAERFAWQYTPGPRHGLSLAAMTEGQRDAAQAIVRTAMSARGATEAAAIVALEPILGAIERAAGHPMGEERDPGRYWFSIFGDPTGAEPWSWRLSGHHLLVQGTAVGDRVAFAPSFLGANPAVVPSGPARGSRALTGEETLARDLVLGLSPGERSLAVVDPVAPPDVRSGHGRHAIVDGLPVGIRHDELGRAGQAALEALIRHYLGRAPDEVAAQAWHRLAAAGLEAVAFAWAGRVEPGRGHYYAVRGPSFLLEYDNTQDGANHIHSVWRDLEGDWGEDLLAAHYRTAHDMRSNAMEPQDAFPAT